MKKLIAMLKPLVDEEQIILNPLPEHAVKKEDEDFKYQYGLLIASALTSQSQIGKNQTRLFLLLLNSLGLGDKRAALFEAAEALEQNTLLEASRAMRDAGFAQNLLLDILILLRIDEPVSEETSELIVMFASLLGLSAEQVTTRAEQAAEILGLNCVEEGLLYQHWPAKIANQLTAAALEEGLQGGLWLLDSKLTVNFPWQAEGAAIIFSPKAELYTDIHQGEILFNDCSIQLGKMKFSGQGFLKITDCNWVGEYLESSIACDITGIEVVINNSYFNTNNTLALKVTGSNLNVINSKFERCGGESTLAGAIVHQNEAHSQEIEGSQFIGCVGQAGAFWTFNCQSIISCEFVDNVSTGIESVENNSIYTLNQIQGSPAIKNSIFRGNAVYIGGCYWSSKIIFILECQFVDSGIYYHDKYSSNIMHSGCAFDNSPVIDKKLELTVNLFYKEVI